MVVFLVATTLALWYYLQNKIPACVQMHAPPSGDLKKKKHETPWACKVRKRDEKKKNIAGEKTTL